MITRSAAPGSAADEGNLPEGLRLTRARINGKWQNVINVAAWKAIEKSAPADSNILLQLRDSEGVSVYRVITAPSLPTAPVA